MSDLKEYIYKNNKIEFILEQIGCHTIKYHQDKEYYSCANMPNKDGDGNNPTAINIRNNKYLNCRNYTRQQYFDEKSDLITLVQYNKGYTFTEAIKYLHNILGLKFSYSKTVEPKKEMKDPLEIFKRVRYKRNRTNVLDLKVLDEDILYDFAPYIHISWYREGIMPWTVKKFGLGYSHRWKRVVIPMRYWLTGELLGTNARTTVENYDLFDIPKYYITPSYPKSYNLFGLWENRQEIEQLKYVTVFESEKSVLKRDSLNDCSGIALSGCTMSDEQVRIILGLDIREVVIALDKDVDINEVRHICEKFYRLRKVSYIYDKWDLLGDKDSPADARNQIYEFLFKYRTVYDEREHEEYLKSLKGK